MPKVSKQGRDDSIKAKVNTWALKSAFSIFMVKLYGFCLSIAYIAHQRHSYIVYRLSDNLCTYIDR